MTVRLRIAGGRVYDPLSGVDGEVRDICITDGRVVEGLPSDAPALDARGLVVLPGGVDIHCHIAGPKVNLARRLEPERHRGDVVPQRVRDATGDGGSLRSGTGGTVPSTFATGYRYAGLGYTTAFEAAVPALGARHAHQELDDTPIIDKGFYLLLGNDEFLLRQFAAGEDERAREAIARALAAARAYAVKVVNPGGVVAWKRGGPISGVDDEVPGLGVTPRRVVNGIAAAADTLDLPHPMHIHCNNLGVPGNAATTLETMRAVDGRRAHFTHVQFHSYEGAAGERPISGTRRLVEYVNERANLSIDVGQVMFGAATTMTADLPVAHLLHRLTGGKWVAQDLELDSGCGIVPYEYREKNYVHALQWAIGLEWFLLAKDPWRVVLSTDHPNGGSFLAYPRLIRLLMDRTFRDQRIRAVDARAIRETALADGLDREYTLYEIAIITRAAPARLLGLERKGHLAPGADADVTIYAPDNDVERMFAAPRHVLKGGVPVVEDGELRDQVWGRTFHVAPPYDPTIEQQFRRFLQGSGTVAPDQYWVGDEEIRHAECIPARKDTARRAEGSPRRQAQGAPGDPA